MQHTPADAGDLLIVEGIMTTLGDDGAANVAPMGPRVDRDFGRFTLRPFTSSTTYRNLKRSGQGVFHIVDDVELLARAAVGALETPPPSRAAEKVAGVILEDACRWYELVVEDLDDRTERTTIHCRPVANGAKRDFLGFNRAKHAVVEAAILATRIGILPADEIRRDMERLAVIVEKTAGIQERRAFEFLRRYIEPKLPPNGA